MEFVLEVSPEPEIRGNYGGACELSVLNKCVALGTHAPDTKRPTPAPLPLPPRGHGRLA